MAESDIEVQGLKELREKLSNLSIVIPKGTSDGMEKACKRAAQNIQITFRGNPGFKDVTGALRASITGGLLSESQNEVVGFVGAGDDRIGSGKKPTRDYVYYVEFPELRGLRQTIVRVSKTGRTPSGKFDVIGGVPGAVELRPHQASTSFLRPGVFGLQTQMLKIVANEILKYIKLGLS